MPTRILLGPILGYEDGGRYTVFLLVSELSPSLAWSVAGQSIPFSLIADLHFGVAVRAEYCPPVAPNGGWCRYSITELGAKVPAASKLTDWQFYIPGAAEEPRIAYCSCNGFSALKLLKDTKEPYAMWERMRQLHEPLPATDPSAAGHAPFALLLMGGDQVYADGIWEEGGPDCLSDWSYLSDKDRRAKTLDGPLCIEIEQYYENLYIRRWNRPELATMLASVPSVMMWDDHDIFDGWGSYPEDLQRTDVFVKVFAAARRAFAVFQIRGSTNHSLIDPANAAYSLRLTFGRYHLLVLDNRSQRTQVQLMERSHWDAVKASLAALPAAPGVRLLVMAGVPVIYRTFELAEQVLTLTSAQEEIEDDLLDHWSARGHVVDRDRLISLLLDVSAARSDCRIVILSGDVHVGGVGMAYDAARELEIFQIISSGIVHPPPSLLQWAVVKAASSDEPVPINNGDVTLEMLRASGAGEVIRERNFAWLQWGSDQRLWVNWTCEHAKTPVFSIGAVKQLAAHP